MSNFSSPLISIIIPTYNRKELFKKALESAINQTYKNLEIIVADNHSTDGTEELCREYAHDERIKYFRHESNLGMTKNCDFAHKQVQGEYFVALCDDDFLDVDFVEKSYLAMKGNNYSFIHQTVKVYDCDGKYLYKAPLVDLSDKNLYKRIKNFVKANRSGYYLATGLFRTSILKEMIAEDGFVLKERFGEDWTLMIKFLLPAPAKDIDTTHHNKLNNGLSTTLDGVEELWGNTNTYKGDFNKAVFEGIKDALNTDEFCKNRLTEKQTKYLCDSTEKALLKTKKQLPFGFLMRFLNNYFVNKSLKY